MRSFAFSRLSAPLFCSLSRIPEKGRTPTVGSWQLSLYSTVRTNQPQIKHTRMSASPPQKRPSGNGESGSAAGSGSAQKCYLCGASGHLAEACPQGQKEMQNAKITDLPGGGRIIDAEGDLMTAPDSLCHCVSECLAMGKGIAVLFKQKFGGVDELKAQRVKVGGVAILHRPSETRPERHVYYLITKPKFSDKPTYDTLGMSLGAMFSHMHANGIKSISMPEIGCGLDGLSWPKVHEMLCAMVAGSGITVTVYHFKPAQQMWSKKASYA
jgi:O-acetyl-ADP-ribose deacetylase (regulator of RNase III)